MITTIDGFVQRIADGFYQIDPRQNEFRTAPSSFGTFAWCVNWVWTIPSMPSGVSAFIVTKAEIGTGPQVGSHLLCKRVLLGTLDISTNVFTDAGVMPSLTELGVSRQIPGPILVEYVTALGGTPGTLTLTYTDQDGNTAAGGALTMPSGVAGSATVYPLSSPDWGAVDVTAAVRGGGAAPTGTVAIYGLYEPLGSLTAYATSMWNPMSFLGADFNPVRLDAGDELVMLTQAGATGAFGRITVLTTVGDTP